ncbi:MAG: Gfo/Idh/MocA family oxidoreductase [Kiritimatiellaeota bacterium]|nr:Gfo/Idh/MocA family oxidoreductase [Kiritimatiellota bacterium]
MISKAYLTASQNLLDIDIVKCADLNMEAAKAKAEEYGLLPMAVDELLADPEIEIVLNLTIPAAHAQVNKQILNAGKHAYCEKPFAVDLEDGREVLELAKEKGLRVGCAPDTFLGAGNQTCRKILDDGWIGNVLSGTAFMMSAGVENWHSNPGFYYLKGGGPLFDMGPYYITALVNLLGPVGSVCAAGKKGFSERIRTCDDRYGEIYPVEVNTHVTGNLLFKNGAVITLVMSFDVKKHSHKPIELYGETGTLQVPDPNTFSGPVNLSMKGGEWMEAPLSHGYDEQMRSIGVADMARAIKTNTPARASGDLAFHVLEVMHALERSSAERFFVDIESEPEQPAPLPLHLQPGKLDE